MDGTVATDQDLIEVIERLLPAVRNYLDQESAAPSEGPVDVLSIWDIAGPLRTALETHPDSANSGSRFFLGKQIAFSSQYQAMNILRVAIRIGAVEALAWYRRVLATTHAKMRVVAEVYGLFVRQPHTFSNGITLLPVSELPDSPNSRFLKQPVGLRFAPEFPAAVLFEVGEVERDDSPEVGHERFLEISERMQKTVTAFVLSDAVAPTMGATWQEFANPELEWAEFGRVWSSSGAHDGRRSPHPANVTDGMIEWVEKYLRLPREVALACDVPLSRLNLARRRVAPGDKAIDGSVCLEALLSGRSRGELTHKVSVRTALLLGSSLEERQKIAEKVRRFYGLRSDIIHGSRGNKEAADDKTALDGLSLCLDCLREIVISGIVPMPETWELAGGPPWNLYKSSVKKPG